MLSSVVKPGAYSDNLVGGGSPGAFDITAMGFPAVFEDMLTAFPQIPAAFGAGGGRGPLPLSMFEVSLGAF